MKDLEDFIHRSGSASNILDLHICYPYVDNFDEVIQLLQQLRELECLVLQLFDDQSDPLLRALEWPAKGQTETANDEEPPTNLARHRLCPELLTLKLNEITLSAAALESMLRSRLPAYLDDPGDGKDPSFLMHVEIGEVHFTDEDSVNVHRVLQWLVDAGEEGLFKFERRNLEADDSE